MNKEQNVEGLNASPAIAKPMLAAVVRYLKNNAVLHSCVICLVFLYDSNVLDYRYWLTSIIVWLAGVWQSDFNSR